MQSNITRRTFHRLGMAGVASLTALQASRVVGANDRVRLGFIGVANRGRQDLAAFREQADAEVVALCDVDRLTLDKAQEAVGGKARLYADFRKLLEASDIDAVVIATPDHWHALQTIAACRAGKDVYVEKPLSMTIREGRRMVEVATQTKRVVQVGTHRRSSALFAEFAGMVQGGKIGKVTVSRCYHASNMAPTGIGHGKPTAPPETLDWDMWLGPRPARPYQDNIAPYKFRWWHLYSSQVANQGIHYLDTIRWMTGDLAPRWIAALGGRFAVDDDRTIPDTMEATFECPSGHLIVLGQYEACGNQPLPQKALAELRGTLGTAYVNDSVVQLVPEVGGQFQDHAPRIKPEEIKATEAKIRGRANANLSLTGQHARNFLDCIKSRGKPNADIETGHRSTTFSHLANIALATRSTLEWDAQQERILNHPTANDLLQYEYRKPWTLD